MIIKQLGPDRLTNSFQLQFFCLGPIFMDRVHRGDEWMWITSEFSDRTIFLWCNNENTTV